MSGLVEGIVSSLIALLVGLSVAYLVYRYKERQSHSVEFHAETMIGGPIVEIVVTNHGRSTIVITELNAYIPAKQIFPSELLPMPAPTFEKPRFSNIRRKMRLLVSRNDAFTVMAEKCLQEGAGRAQILPSTQTIKIEPGERASRAIEGQDRTSYNPLKFEVPDSALWLVPSCKTSKNKTEIWGPPVMIARAKGSECNIMVVNSR